MVKKITFIGVGYVGLLSSLSIAKYNPNLNVFAYDVDVSKIDLLDSRTPTFYEEGLSDLLKETSNIYFTSDMNLAFFDTDIIFFCVNTPLDKDTDKLDISILLDSLESASKRITKDCIFVIKSTIPIGTMNYIEKNIISNKFKISFVNIPEFLAQGTAVNNALFPNRVIIGANSNESIKIICEIFKNFNCPIITMNTLESELSKIVANCFLANKLSFINDISNICRNLNISISNIIKGIKYDSRIGSEYMEPGPGYGGSCLPKDTKSFYYWALENNYELKSVKSSIDINLNQRKIVLKIIMDKLLEYKKDSSSKILFLGASFKNGTDDLRESVAIKIIEDLIMNHLSVYVHDDLVSPENMLKSNSKIKYVTDLETLEKVDVVVLFNDVEDKKWFIIKKIIDNKTIFINLKFNSKIPENILQEFNWVNLNK